MQVKLYINLSLNGKEIKANSGHCLAFHKTVEPRRHFIVVLDFGRILNTAVVNESIKQQGWDYYKDENFKTTLGNIRKLQYHTIKLLNITHSETFKRSNQKPPKIFEAIMKLANTRFLDENGRAELIN